jgi:hypothetical protein
MGFKKGHTKIGGKIKGTENKLTGKARMVFVNIMEGEIDNIKNALDKVRTKDPSAYLNILSKFYPYFMPKQLDITSGGEAFEAPNIIAPNGHKPK